MKHRPYIIAKYLTLGAVINVAAAWFCAITNNYILLTFNPFVYAVPVDEFIWEIAICDAWGTLQIKSIPIPNSVFHNTPKQYNSFDKMVTSNEMILDEIHKLDRIPNWFVIPTQNPAAVMKKPWYEIQQAHGWPFLSMRCDVAEHDIQIRRGLLRNAPPFDYRIEGDEMVVIDGSANPATRMKLAPGDSVKYGLLVSVDSYGFQVIPFMPIWSGFILNTLFYGSILLLNTAAILKLKSLKQSRRRSKGLCIKCTYDLRGADHEVCPECGTPLASSQ